MSVRTMRTPRVVHPEPEIRSAMQRTPRARTAVTDIALSALAAMQPPTHHHPAGPHQVAPLVDSVLQSFLRAVGGDAAGFWEHIRGGWSTPLFVTPPQVWQRLPYRRTLTSDAARIHPGVQHCLEACPTSPFTVTDLLPESAWQNSEIGRTMRPSWGRNFQLMVPIDTDPVDPTWWVWVIGREHLDFTPADRQVASAVQPLLTAVTRHVAATQRADLPIDVAQALTPRERSILGLLLDGHPITEIASRLSISARTAHKHTEHIYRKLGVHDRHTLAEAISIRALPRGEL